MCVVITKSRPVFVFLHFSWGNHHTRLSDVLNTSLVMGSYLNSIIIIISVLVLVPLWNIFSLLYSCNVNMFESNVISNIFLLSFLLICEENSLYLVPRLSQWIVRILVYTLNLYLYLENLNHQQWLMRELEQFKYFICYGSSLMIGCWYFSSSW